MMLCAAREAMFQKDYIYTFLAFDFYITPLDQMAERLRRQTRILFLSFLSVSVSERRFKSCSGRLTFFGLSFSFPFAGRRRQTPFLFQLWLWLCICLYLSADNLEWHMVSNFAAWGRVGAGGVVI